MILAKFDDTKHPRGKGGEFASKGGAATPAAGAVPVKPLSAFEQKWTDARGGKTWATARSAVPQSRSSGAVGWQTLGSKIAELPADYTGSKEPSLPDGSFTEHKMAWQIPKAVGVDKHMLLHRKMVQMIRDEQAPTIEKASTTQVPVRGQKVDMIPEGTPKGLVNRAYRHSALLALHDFGLGVYDFKMDDQLKADLGPLQHFMRHARRRLVDKMRAGDLKGAWKPYRQEFGVPFKDKRTVKGSNTGEIRLRVPPRDQLIKAMMPRQPLAFVLIGMPGAGKSTFRRQLVASHPQHLVQIASDDIIDAHAHASGLTYNQAFDQMNHKGIERVLQDKLKTAVAGRHDIVVDQTNLSPKSRSRTLRELPAHYRKIAVTFDMHPKELARRQASRPGKVIPDGVLRQMRVSYKPPQPGEFDEVRSSQDQHLMMKAADPVHEVEPPAAHPLVRQVLPPDLQHLAYSAEPVSERVQATTGAIHPLVLRVMPDVTRIEGLARVRQQQRQAGMHAAADAVANPRVPLARALRAG